MIRHITKHLTHQKVLQSEIMRVDRRCTEAYHLFHTAANLRIKNLANNIRMCLRRSRDPSHNKITYLIVILLEI